MPKQSNEGVGAGRAVLAVALAIAGLAAGGCGRERLLGAQARDPLASLRSASESRSFDLAFWAQQERARTPVWQQAAAFCRGRAERLYPNCGAVRMAGWWGNPPPPPAPPEIPQPPFAPLSASAAQRAPAAAPGDRR
ncbi:MAG TPA: hypothetical protein VHR45_18465 [Thermoanaerobaculia bacterium]|nr:hypothetical protein [Thermoanaerobaculia bacterium]